MVMARLATIGKYVQTPELSMFFNRKAYLEKGFDLSVEAFKAFEEAGIAAVPKILRRDSAATAMKISELLEKQYPKVEQQIYGIFGNSESTLQISMRAKGAISIEPKLAKALTKGKVSSWEDAVRTIGDGEGSRIISKSLPKLDNTQIETMIKQLKIYGKALNKEQTKLLRRYIYNDSMTLAEQEEAFPLFEKFAQPLIEAHSQSNVDNLCLSIAKYKMWSEGLTIEEIKELNLLEPSLIKRLETEKIIPLQVLEINNYRGKFGLPEFSEAQIAQIRDIASKSKKYNSKEIDGLNLTKADRQKFDDAIPDVIIHSRADMLGTHRWDEYREFEKQIELAKKSKDMDLLKSLEKKYSQIIKEDAVKASGYRTAQMNVRHINGAYGEPQFRGEYTNIMGELEHVAYDLRQGKNTLGPIFREYASAIKKLTDGQYDAYNVYLEKYYNYYNRLELGLPAVKPRLPKGLKQILSLENMEKLYKQHEAMLKEAKVGFQKHCEYIL